MSLDLIEALALAPELAQWDGLGLAVQAYQKRALPLIDWLADLARRGRRRLMVRLVKGAYWDSEIKRSQERGLDGYPVYTRKVATDVSYLAAARRLLAAGSAFYPQFATHNAHTVAAVLELAGGRRDWEFQRLHGMGEALYDEIVGPEGEDRPRAGSTRRSAATRNCSPISCADCSKTAPTPPLSTASSTTSSRSTRSSPIRWRGSPGCRSSRIRASRCPPTSTLPARRNSRGIDLADPPALTALRDGLAAAMRQPWHAAPIVGGVEQPGAAEPVFDPSDHRRQVGSGGRGRADSSSTGRSTAPVMPPRPGTAARPASAPRSSNAPPTSTRATAPS